MKISMAVLFILSVSAFGEVKPKVTTPRIVEYAVPVDQSGKPIPTAAGPGEGGGGGNWDRKTLHDLTIEALQNLEGFQNLHALVMPDGSVISAFHLEEEFRLYLKLHDMKIYTTLIQPCPLVDRAGTCTEFLTDPKTKQLSIDLARVHNRFTDQHMDELNQRDYFVTQLLHETFRMAEFTDVKNPNNLQFDDQLYNDNDYEKSTFLQQLVEQMVNGLEFNVFLSGDDPQFTGPIRNSPLTVSDLLNKKFYFYEYDLNVYYEFKVVGSHLYASEISLSGPQDSQDANLDCGEVNKITFKTQSIFKCVSTHEPTRYINVDVHKPLHAPMFLNVGMASLNYTLHGWVEH